MGKIVAIGGGEIRDLETLPIDTYIVSLTGRSQPKALFIPTASHEASGYIETFNRVYSGLGCITSTLYLIDSPLTDEEIKEMILSSDIIYVGGGDTKFMLDIWKTKKVDEYLKEAYENNIVLTGLSAGSICWFEKGHSDYAMIRDEKKVKEFHLIEGLGLIKGIHCPHFDDDLRKEDFPSKITNPTDFGIALEENCALEIIDGQYRILKSNEEAKAYRFYQSNGKTSKEELSNNRYQPLIELYKV